MDCSVQCPHCGRLQPLQAHMAGNVVACPACGQAFGVPAAMPPPTVPSVPSGMAGPGQQQGPAGFGMGGAFGTGGMLDGLDAAATGIGNPLGAAFGAGGPLAAGMPSYRRRRMTAGDRSCLYAGIVLAVVGLGCLLVLFPLAQMAGLGWTATGVILALAGAGLIGFSQRRQLVVALPAAAAIVGLVVIGVTIRPLPKTHEQLADELIGRCQDFVAALDTIHDEATLRAARPKVLAALTSIFDIAEQATRLEAEGQRVSPEVERKLSTAMSNPALRSAGGGRQLLSIPGSEGLLQDMARIVADGQKRLAAIRDSGRSRPAPTPPMFASPDGGQPRAPIGSNYAPQGRKTELVGGSQPGAAFESLPPHSLVTGIAFRPGEWNGEPGFDDIQPLRTTVPPQGLEAVAARSGYAVGAITADTGQFFHAMQVTFMRIRPDGRLDPDDSYKSDWIGTPVGQQTNTVSCKGAKVIGLHGQRIGLVHSIGLVLE